MENVQIERGWVTTSSNRREWLFTQFDGDMSKEGVLQYRKLNNLGERVTAPAMPAPAVCS